MFCASHAIQETLSHMQGKQLLVQYACLHIGLLGQQLARCTHLAQYMCTPICTNLEIFLNMCPKYIPGVLIVKDIMYNVYNRLKLVHVLA